MTALNEFLQASPYFAGLSSPEIESISKLIFEKSVMKGEMITWEGNTGDALYFVVSGAVKCFKTSEDGKEQIIQIALPGNSFNDVAVFDGGPSSTSSEAMSLVSLYGIARLDMQKMMDDHPNLAANIVKVMAKHIRSLLDLVEDLSFRHVINRIARVLMDYATDGTGSKPKLTQQEMAAMTGTAREVVGRSLKTLQEEGIIRMERNRLVIANKETLQHMANSTT
ncbi:MAG: Crp/Fnr family transcriptional regulator [Chloroflexota bacterium]|nr:Crp/Fnr family transcriptional regulator [Chloroflexota bacterium]